MLSGPVELLFEVAQIASAVCVVVIVSLVESSFLVCLLIFLLVFLVWCFTVLTNCLLNASAFCCGVIACLLLKVIMVLGCAGGFLPLS